MMKYRVNNNPRFQNKQKGATLMVVMVFLVLMTIVTVSATKISILDILISGNDQQRVIAFTTAENNLTQFAQTSELNKAYAADGFDNAAQLYSDPASTNALTKNITDMSEQYPCERAGLGSSMGGAAPPCSLYDFQIRLNQQNTGVREDHHKGGGKMVPNSGSKSSLL